MAGRSAKVREAEIAREAQRFANEAYSLGQAQVDNALTEEQRARARAMAEELPAVSKRMQDLSEAQKTAALKALADARLDLVFVSSGGKAPSSTRLGFYAQERAAAETGE